MAPDTLDAPADTALEISNPPDPIQLPIQIDSDRVVLDKKILEAKRAGMSQREIAREFKVSNGFVQRSLERQIKGFIKETGMSLTVTREEIQSKIFLLAPKMLENVESIANGNVKPEVKLKASTDLLDRAGFAPVQRSIQLTIIEEMSKDDLIGAIRSLLTTPDISPVISVSPSTPSVEPSLTTPSVGVA